MEVPTKALLLKLRRCLPFQMEDSALSCRDISPREKRIRETAHSSMCGNFMVTRSMVWIEIYSMIEKYRFELKEQISCRTWKFCLICII